MSDKSDEIKGVGLTFHPLLYNAMMARRFAFDFVEWPIEYYADASRAGLLDPGEQRLRQIAAQWPGVGRGSVMSLGSVEAPDDVSCDPRQARIVRKWFEASRAKALIETIGFRRLEGRDLGRAQRLPYCVASANWIAARFNAAQDSLDVPLLLQLSRSDFAICGDEMDGFAYLSALADRVNCEFVLDVADVARLAAEAGLEVDEALPRVANLPVAMLTLAGERDEDWVALQRIREHSDPRAIVLRRFKYLFPLDEIGGALQRARSVLGDVSKSRARPQRAVEPIVLDPAALAGLQAEQRQTVSAALSEARADGEAGGEQKYENLAKKVKSWQTWHARVDDAFKGQQIKKFMAQDF